MNRTFVLLLDTLLMLAAAAHAQSTNELPEYKPTAPISGVIRTYGTGLFGLVKDWEAGFQRANPSVRFEDTLKTGDGFAGGLESGAADLSFSDRDPVLTEYLSFFETFGVPLSQSEVDVATGSYDIIGRTWAPVIYVSKDNPIKGLTMDQLDGIFGEARTGGYRDFKYYPQYARGADKNIRTWGQLGLSGEWKDKPIQTCGYAFTGMRNFFQMAVFHGGDKWNPNYREYVESDTKMVSEGTAGISVSSHHMLAVDMQDGTCGIAWSGIGHAVGMTHMKVVPIAAAEGEQFITPTKETVQDKTYALSRPLHAFFIRPAGQSLDPKVAEFLRYILSRQGQEDVIKNGNVLPLTTTAVKVNLQRLE